MKPGQAVLTTDSTPSSIKHYNLTRPGTAVRVERADRLLADALHISMEITSSQHNYIMCLYTYAYIVFEFMLGKRRTPSTPGEDAPV
jgi:hypothetical protein